MDQLCLSACGFTLEELDKAFMKRNDTQYIGECPSTVKLLSIISQLCRQHLKSWEQSWTNPWVQCYHNTWLVYGQFLEEQMSQTRVLKIFLCVFTLNLCSPFALWPYILKHDPRRTECPCLLKTLYIYQAGSLTGDMEAHLMLHFSLPLSLKHYSDSGLLTQLESCTDDSDFKPCNLTWTPHLSSPTLQT